MAKRKKRKVIFISVLILLALALSAPVAISAYVKTSMDDYLITEEAALKIDADCILVLGAGLKADGTPNYMLQDRLDKGIELYKAGAAPKLLLSGDNGQEKYDEVNAMKEYTLNAGIPYEDIFLDHAGFSTYESMYRARDIFLVEKVIIITQRYHQYRALYTGRGLGIESYGVVSEPRTYAGQGYRDIREMLARNKDFLKMIIKPEPTYLGETIPINGSGLASHD
ncbi:MAG TPA: ElyC/SanA/YdcF family protein [Anaerovoracaceae bacterium]|nr:ElyC/SanA/YdcF family protein [Anaerovoracaceae bacterium]